MRVMISCGEPSGDLYAGALAEALRQRDPAIEIVGFGGPRLKAAGAELVGDFAGLSVTGLTEALRVVPRARAMLRRLTDAARARQPDVFVPIDFPDFNFRLMAAMRRLGIPVVYYISPQLWAWRSGRMATMKRDADRVLVIFPFEEAIYQNAGVPVEFVGHPLVDLARTTEPRSTFLDAQGLRPDTPTIALLPGSRSNEVRRIAPTIADALPLIAARIRDVQFVVAAAPSLSETLFHPLSQAADALGPAAGRPRLIYVRDRADDVLASSDVVMTASGTATVQAALHERPMVVVYRLSPLTYRLGKPFVKVDTYAMPNLVAGTRIVPELIQDGFTPERVAAETIRLFEDRELHARTREALRRVRERLGEPGATGRAADAVLAVARGHVRRKPDSTPQT
jgi:lipid-A-disaccharide synthase